MIEVSCGRSRLSPCVLTDEGTAAQQLVFSDGSYTEYGVSSVELGL